VGRVIAFEVAIVGEAGASVMPRVSCDWPVHLEPEAPRLNEAGQASVRVSSLVLGPIGSRVCVSIDVPGGARIELADPSVRTDAPAGASGVRAGGTRVVVEMLALDEHDLNEDGVVDAKDLAIFRAWWLAGDKRADFNADGFVNADDHDQFSERFEEPRPSERGTGEDAESPG
jgi:hypothetical protein